MAKTARMEQLEAMLLEDPHDAFLRYGLAMEHTSAGDDTTATVVLLELIALKQTDPYIPAYLQAGQSLMRLGREPESALVLREGIEAAHKTNDHHAMGEMQALLATVE